MPYAPLGFAACTFQPLSRSHIETRQLYSLSPQPRSASSARAIALAEPGLGAGTAGGLGAGTAGGVGARTAGGGGGRAGGGGAARAPSGGGGGGGGGPGRPPGAAPANSGLWVWGG